jgi:hypothetical protein
MVGLLGHILQSGGEYSGPPCLCGTKLYSKIPTLVIFKTITMRGCSTLLPPPPQVYRNMFMRWWCETVMWDVTGCGLVNGEHRFGSE